MSKRKRSAVRTYFDNEEGTDAICLLCNDIVKTSGNTSNALKHLKNKHHSEFQLVQEEQEETKRKKTDQQSVKGPEQATLVSTIEQSQAYTRESACCKKLDNSLIKMLAMDLQPASIVEDKGFQLFLYAIDPRY